jgi:acylphosphatase
MTGRPTLPPTECWQVRVTGRVQGVGFREACVDRAQLLGLTGWVRNRIDGSVEAMLQGDADALARMREWLRRGPVLARVDRMQETRLDAPFPRFENFERRPTG